MSNSTLNTDLSNKNNHKNSADFETACLEHMARNGLPFNGPLVMDHIIKRWSCDDKPYDKDEWYVAHPDDGDLTVIYGSNSKNKPQFVYKSYSDEDGTIEQRAERRKKYEAMIKNAEEQRLTASNVAAQKAKEILDNSLEVPQESQLGYIKSKGLTPEGIRFDPRKGSTCVYIPMRNIEAEIRTLQLIFFDTKKNGYSKNFLSGSFAKGNFHIINGESFIDGDILFICEGWATGRSVYDAVKNDKTHVICAMSKCNIETIVVALLSRFKRCEVIIAGDNDKDCSKVNSIAKKYGLKIVLPICKNGKDFNDLFQESGTEEVRRQLQAAQHLEGDKLDMKAIAKKHLTPKDLCETFDIDKLPKNMKKFVMDKLDGASVMSSIHPLLVTNSLLCTMSALINTRRHVCLIPNRRLFCNLWMLSMSPSGSSKSSALSMGNCIATEKEKEVNNEISHILRDIEYVSPDAKKDKYREIAKLIAQSPVIPYKGSTEGLLKKMSYGQKGSMYIGEYQSFTSDFEKPYNQDKKSTLTELYDHDGMYSNSLTNMEKAVMIDQPFLSICALSTKAWVITSFKQDDIASGWFPRFLIYSMNTLEPVDNPVSKPFNSDFEYELRFILENLGHDRRYEFAHDAWLNYLEVRKALDVMYREYDSKYHSILECFIPRWKTYIAKIAIIMQVAIDSSTNVISNFAIEAALNMVTPAIHSTLHTLQGDLSLSEYQRQLKSLLQYIREQTLASSNGFVPKHNILASGILPGGLKAYDDALKMLHECKVIDSAKDLGYNSTMLDLNF